MINWLSVTRQIFLYFKISIVIIHWSDKIMIINVINFTNCMIYINTPKRYDIYQEHCVHKKNKLFKKFSIIHALFHNIYSVTMIWIRVHSLLRIQIYWTKTKSIIQFFIIDLHSSEVQDHNSAPLKISLLFEIFCLWEVRPAYRSIMWDPLALIYSLSDSIGSFYV